MRHYLRENLRRSFTEWDRGERLLNATGYLATLLAVLLSGFLWANGWQKTVGVALPAAAMLWAFVVVVIITPARMWIDLRAEADSTSAELDSVASHYATDMRHEIGDQLKSLSDLAAEGRILETQVRKMQSWDNEMDNIIDSWTTIVSDYLADELPEFYEQFWSDSRGREIAQPGVPFEVADRGNMVERRREQLMEIIRQVTARQGWYRGNE